MELYVIAALSCVLVFAGLSSVQGACDPAAMAKCPAPDMAGFDQNNEADVKKLCKSAAEYNSCMIKAVGDCDADVKKQMENASKQFKEICNAGTTTTISYVLTTVALLFAAKAWM